MKKNVIVQPKFNRNAAQPIVTQGQYYSFPTEEQLTGQQAPLQRQANEVPQQIPLVYSQQANVQPIRTTTNNGAAQFQAVVSYPAQGNPAITRPLQGMQSPNLVVPSVQTINEGTVPLDVIPTQPQAVTTVHQNDISQLTESVLPPSVPAQPLARQEPPHGNLRNGVRYFYYDPHATAQDARGNVYLPEFVYDADGKAIHLQSLAKSKSIFISPPRTMIHHNITTSNSTTTLNYTHPNTIHTPVHRQAPAKGIPLSDWGTSHRSDSSVIVGTVGVMALLVGALSARKLRSRNLLSACIENETLEDEAAYDAAHTHHYNTFQQGWKGDLEKFDV